MPTSPLKILLVEDAEHLPELMQKVITPLLQRFPHSEVMTTPSLARALDLISECPPPDVVTLDLTLADSSLENTMAHVEQIEGRSPVVLVTGGNVDTWRDMLEQLQIEVIDKSSDWLRGNVLVMAIVRAVMRGKTREAQRVNERLAAMRDLNEQLTHGVA